MRCVLNLKFSDLTFINFRVKLKKNQFEEKKMRNKKCFLRHTNTLLYISWYWTVHSILFTGHPGVINVVRQTHCKQSLVEISVILIFHKCLFHYHQSSLNICVDPVVHCLIPVQKVQKRSRTTWRNMSCIFILEFYYFAAKICI